MILVDFYPIRPVINAWSNLSNVRAFESSSQCISTQFDRFDQASSQWISTQFDQVNTKLHNTSEVDSTSKLTGFIKLLHF